MRIVHALTIIVFFIFIGGFALVNFITTDKEFSFFENRYLNQIPQFSAASFFSGDWSEDIEAYTNDQFVLRDAFVALKSYTEQALGKTENHGIYLSEEGSLIQQFVAPDYTLVDKNIAAIKSLLDSSDIPIYTTIIPTANDIYHYKLPEYTPTISELEFIEYVEDNLDQCIHVYDTLLAHNTEDIYYNTDHHWTSLGAYYAYCEIITALKAEDAVSLDSYTSELLSSSFYGSTYASSGVRNVTSDSITIYVPNQNILVYDDATPSDQSLYDYEQLGTSDEYRVFQGGNYPLVALSGSGEGNLLIVKDSFANSLVPFLLAHYEHIYMIDLRYNRTGIDHYIDEYDISEILICYSTTNFSTDTNLVFFNNQT